MDVSRQINRFFLVFYSLDISYLQTLSFFIVYQIKSERSLVRFDILLRLLISNVLFIGNHTCMIKRRTSPYEYKEKNEHFFQFVFNDPRKDFLTGLIFYQSIFEKNIFDLIRQCESIPKYESI